MGLRGLTLPTSINHLVGGPDSDGGEEARENAAYYFGRNDSASPWAGSATPCGRSLDSLAPSDPTAMHLLLGLSAPGGPRRQPPVPGVVEGHHPIGGSGPTPPWGPRDGPGTPGFGRASWTPWSEPSTHVAVVGGQWPDRGSAASPRKRSESLKAGSQTTPGSGDGRGPSWRFWGAWGREPSSGTGWMNWPEDEVIPRTRGIGAMTFVPARGHPLPHGAAGSSQPRIRGTALGGLARRWRVERKDPETVARLLRGLQGGAAGPGDPAQPSLRPRRWPIRPSCLSGPWTY